MHEFDYSGSQPFSDFEIPAYTGLDFFPDSGLIPPENTGDTTPPDFWRIEDTPVGPVTVLSENAHDLPYDVYDLTELLAARDPAELHQLDHHYDPHIVLPPGRDDVVLRWTNAGPPSGSRAIPANYSELLSYVADFEQEMGLIKALGIPVLRRNVFIVEYDEHNRENPRIYTAVERHDTPPLVDPFEIDTTEPLRDNEEVHFDTCGKVTDYFTLKAPGQPHISDNLAIPQQYASDGYLLDYDHYRHTAASSLAAQLRALRTRWIVRLPLSRERGILLSRIDDKMAQLLRD